jgi:hypothetical protein
MKPVTSLIVLLSLGAALPALAEDVEAGLAAIKRLGGLNGQALACAEMDAAARAKLLMLTHAPKTQRFGAAYEEATQEGYLAQTRGSAACPDAKDLARNIDEIGQTLRAALPAAQPTAK